MTTMFAAFLGGWEIILILAVVVIFFPRGLLGLLTPGRPTT